MVRGTRLCGSVRYEIHGAPVLMYYCHCGTCRKATGTAFATNMIVLTDAFRVVSGRDTLSSFESSPRKRRYFCSRCGSPIYSQAEQTETMVSVRCGTLDDAPPLRPSVHTHVADQASWFEIRDDLPQKPASIA